MTVLISQSGLFIMSVFTMYVIYGLPVIAVIALILAIVRGIVQKYRSGSGMAAAWAMFVKTFATLSLILGAVVLAACIWANWAIGPR